MLTRLKAHRDATGVAAEPLWREIVLPLLHIGVPPIFGTSMPKRSEINETVAAQGEGEGQVETLALYVDDVPFATPVEDEDGLLGVFSPANARALAVGETGSPNVLLLEGEALTALAKDLDIDKAKAAVAQFRDKMTAAGVKNMVSLEDSELVKGAFTLLKDLKEILKVCADKGHTLALRRMTVAEASSEGPLQALSEALNTSNIIIAAR